MYIKYEKVLYEITDKEADLFREKIQKGGQMFISGEVLNAKKCELVKELPHNRDDYEIRYANHQLTTYSDEYYDRINKEHAENMKQWLSQTPEQKTKRNWECIAKTKYLLRNEWKEPNLQRVEMIKDRMTKWFQDNDKAWCPEEIYENLLPLVESKEKVGGWQKIGALIK